jgi:hypothetical protein
MADQNLTQLTATSTLADTDLVYAVVDPAGTPLDRKVSVADLRTEMQDGAVKPNGTTTLANADGVFQSVVIDDFNTSGPDRFTFSVDTRLVSWFNEFGEFRVMPSNASRVGLRVFAALNDTEHGNRSASNLVFEVADYRTGTDPRKTVFGVNHLGDTTVKGNLTVDGTVTADIGVRIAGILDHNQSPPGGTPSGTIYLVRPAP